MAGSKMARTKTRKPLTKSEQMSRVRVKDTKPERLIRSLLSERGVRYRLHLKTLPGHPDIYISRLRLAIFVHGCFWHGHDCTRGTAPKSNVDFWQAKLTRNVRRDSEQIAKLLEKGIDTKVVWECQVHAAARECDAIAYSYERQA
jgi:DNA mismatch endonuclease (patch repair protein)